MTDYSNRHFGAPTIQFRSANLNSLDLEENGFDAITAIDSIYFASSFESTIDAMLGALKPSGVMCVFYSEHLGKETNIENIQPKGTNLGKVLLIPAY